MRFASTPPRFFVDLSENGPLLARADATAEGLLVGQLAEAPADDAAALASMLAEHLPKKGSGYLHATCGVYPPRRLVRRVTLEPKRLKEPAYLDELVATQCRVEADKYVLSLINAADGLEYDTARAAVKDVLVCGLPSEDVIDVQDGLLAKKIYPERLELATVATIGGLSDYLRFEQAKSPTLMLELGMDATQSFIVTADGLEASRPIPHGLASMVPVVQKELGLRDEESARKLFFSNTFDFTGMGPLLIKKLLKELQSSIGFYEVQTGQSIGQIFCTQLPPKLAWLEGAIASQLAVTPLRLDLPRWLPSRRITLADSVATPSLGNRWFSLFCLMAQFHAALPEKKD